MLSIIKGFILGLIIVLPGMSGGTVFVILGMYENMIKDIVKFNIKPYIPLLFGILGGIYIGSNAFALFFEAYKDMTLAFLLGALLASVRSVIDIKQKTNIKHFAAVLIGGVIGYYTVGDSISMIPQNIEANKLILLIGGALSSAAMIIPGLPGSSVMFILNIYDIMLVSIKELHLLNLILFGTGSIVGVVLLANILEKIYDKHRDILSYLFSGLIIGSARTLLPSLLSLEVAIIFILAFTLTWHLSRNTA